MHSYAQKCLRGAFVAAAGIGAAAPAQSQQVQATAALEEVVVTGFRKSLRESLEVKRNSELVIDSVAGGDIGALPDVTIAESLVRLPGVNGTRDRGNQSQAVVRGLGPRLALGLVNGREVASSEPSRNVRWEIYPSEVVAGADVYKSQSADLVSGGVAGTIDIRTIRPLEYTGPALMLRGGATYYDGAEDIPGYDPYGYRASGSLNHNVDDRFAFNLGLTSQRQKNAFQSFQGWGFNDGTIYPGNQTGDLDGDGTPDPTPWGAQTEVKKLTEDRNGISGAVGWRLTDRFTLEADALFSKVEIDEDQNQAWYGRNGVTGNWANGSAACYNAANSSFEIRNGSVVAATLADCFTSVTNVIARYTEDKDLFATGIGGTYQGDVWTLGGDVALSTASRDNQWAAFFSEVYPSTLTYNMAGNVRPAVTTSSDPSDPSIQVVPDYLWGQSDGPDDLEDELGAVRLDATRKFNGTLTGISFGARATEREKSFFRRQQFFEPLTNSLPAEMYSSYSIDEFDVPPLLNGNWRQLVNAAYGGMDVDPGSILPGSKWIVDESMLEGYLMARFGGEETSLNFSGNFGVRVVNTESTSWGFETVNGGAFVPVEVENDYTEALPSLNLTFNLSEDKLMRVGLARVIARPPLDELRATRQLFNTTPPPTGSGGNPQLEPFLANQADVSYEWYFAPEALFALAAFYKDVESHIGYTTAPVTIDGVTYAVTGPFNGDGGDIAGVELTFQTPFNFIPGMQNFGIYTNYAYVDSDVKEFFPVTNPLPVEGYAENSAVVDLWYNLGPFEARLGYKYHSGFTIIAGWNSSDVRSLGSESILDFSTAYQVTSKLALRLQVNNLTDEPLRISRDNSLDRLGSYDVYGRRFLLDLTYRN